jgi:glycosyltransferase involved in cell wall biosynthesis
VSAVDPDQASLVAFDVVVPTIGRPDLDALLTALDRGRGPRPGRVVVVDDRDAPDRPLRLPPTPTLDVRVLRSGGRGPASARNLGWRCTTAPWVAFLDDDVVPSPDWFERLVDDLAEMDRDTAASQGRVHVPLPADRRPNDDERRVAGLADAVWITADMAVRRDALVETGGFDERFPRAYREDADLAMRLGDRGWAIRPGRRSITHPTRRAGWWASVRAQRGNADDALMRRLHGRDWRARGRAPAGTLPWHVATTTAAALALLTWFARRRFFAAACAAATIALVARFGWRRAALGPADPHEWLRMAVTSIVIPFAATYHASTGRWRARRLAPEGRADRWGMR